MNKTALGIAIALVALVGILSALNAYTYGQKQGEGLPQDFKEAVFTITGEPISLKDGIAEAKTNLGGDDMTTVRYFGNEVRHDVDGDGAEDVVFLVTQETAAGKVYFYAVGALKREGGYIGSQAVLLDEDISPQTTEKGEGRMVIVNYTKRYGGETQSSIGKSVHLLLDPKDLQFGEVVQNFEGESR